MKDGKLTKEDFLLIAFAFAIKENCKGRKCTDCIFRSEKTDCRLSDVPMFWNLEYNRR